MTEDEAKLKWCPMARVADPAIGTFNRDAVSSKHGIAGWMCLASGCMAWRWELPDSELVGERSPLSRGHCGLAGKP